MKVEARPPYPWEPEGPVVRIETPEQTVVEYQVASFATRFAAALIDGTIIFLGWLAMLLAGILSAVDLDMLKYNSALVIAVGFLFPFLYFVVCEMTMDGRSFGKKLLRCRVIMGTGHGVTFLASLARNLARVIDMFPLVWVIPALDPARRRIGDFIGATIVIMLESHERGMSILGGRRYRELEDRQFSLGAGVGAKLVADDLNLLEYFFRRHGRPARRRATGAQAEAGTIAARKIAARYVERLGLEEQAEAIDEDPKRFLQELYLFLKDRLDERAF